MATIFGYNDYHQAISRKLKKIYTLTILHYMYQFFFKVIVKWSDDGRYGRKM